MHESSGNVEIASNALKSEFCFQRNEYRRTEIGSGSLRSKLLRRGVS